MILLSVLKKNGGELGVVSPQWYNNVKKETNQVINMLFLVRKI